jgi:hypothetical protein
MPACSSDRDRFVAALLYNRRHELLRPWLPVFVEVCEETPPATGTWQIEVGVRGVDPGVSICASVARRRGWPGSSPTAVRFGRFGGSGATRYGRRSLWPDLSREPSAHGPVPGACTPSLGSAISVSKTWMPDQVHGCPVQAHTSWPGIQYILSLSSGHGRTCSGHPRAATGVEERRGSPGRAR